VHTLRYPKQEGGVRVVVAKRTVGKAEQDRGMDAERLCGTACLLHAQLSNLRTPWDRSVGGTLRAVRRDDRVDLDALTCIPGEDRRDRPFIVGVRPDGDERPGPFLGHVRLAQRQEPTP
jgi:hypothetical protein